MTGIHRAFTLLALMAVSAAGCSGGSPADRPIVVGAVSPSPIPGTPPPQPGPPEVEAHEVAPDPGLRRAMDGGPPTAITYRGGVDVPDDLLFFLVAGSDARPGQEVTRSRADSIHVAAVDPRSGEGTILGLPRDAYVDVPGHGRQKITSALALGGPDLLVRTVRELTGFPISYYAVTGFEGIVAMVDELGGLDVFVPERMDDRFSGARFERGWHHMDGREVLAFSRNRHVSGGDFTRSENHGRVIRHALEKMRAEVADRSGIERWVDVLFRHARLDMSPLEAVRFGGLARSLVPADLDNVVAPGSVRNVGGQSVVVLSDEAYELFRDVGADAVADGDAERPTPTPSATPTPTVRPTPSPSPTPTPGGVPTPTPSVDLP